MLNKKIVKLALITCIMSVLVATAEARNFHVEWELDGDNPDVFTLYSADNATVPTFVITVRPLTAN